MEIKSVAIFYGHVASNIGDLAINAGTMHLLRQAFPHATLHFVLLNAQQSRFLQHARASLAGVSLSFISPTAGDALLYQSMPSRFLHDCGVDDFDLIALASGEHLFRYVHGANDTTLFWRTLPAVAAKACGKRCMILPSTFGPFEEKHSKELAASVLDLVDGFATRETYSARLLSSQLNVDAAETLLDPAFFLAPPNLLVVERESGKKTLGLAMRSEGWGIRLSRDGRRELTEQFTTDGFSSSASWRFSVSVCEQFLTEADTSVKLFVQTEADSELANQIHETLSQAGHADAVELYRPASVEDYLGQLSQLHGMVTSRLHATILSLSLGVPVFGAFFDAHGHKMPGLFDLLGLNGKCLALSKWEPEQAAQVAIRGLTKEPAASTVHNRIELLKQQTIDWLKGPTKKKTGTRQLVRAMGSVGEFSIRIVRADNSAVLNRAVQGHIKVHRELTSEVEKTRLHARDLEGRLSTAQSKAAAQAQRAAARISTLEQDASQAEQRACDLERRLSAAQKAHATEAQVLRRRVNEFAKSIDTASSRINRLRGERDQFAKNIEAASSKINWLRGERDRYERKLALETFRRTTIERAIRRLNRWRFGILLTDSFSRKSMEAARKTIEASGLFDREWYAARNPNIKGDPIAHYVYHGAFAGRDPNPLFDTAWYLSKYLAEMGDSASPLAHYITDGARRGFEPHPDFNSAWYRQQVSDLPEDANPLAHFLQHGQPRNLLPKPPRGSHDNSTSSAAPPRTSPDRTSTEAAKPGGTSLPAEDRIRAIVADIRDTYHAELLRHGVERIENQVRANGTELGALRSKARLFNYTPLPGPSLGRYRLTPDPRKIFYLLNNCRPYHNGGYAVRAHGIVQGLMSHGYEVMPIARPGYPSDTIPEADPNKSIEVERVLYRFLGQDSNRYKVQRDTYARYYIDQLVPLVEEHRPSVIHAASFHFNGHAALKIREQYGIPVIYEVRGLSLLIDIGKVPLEHGRHAAMLPSWKRLWEFREEVEVARAADQLLCITEAIASLYCSLGIPSERISVLPNAASEEVAGAALTGRRSSRNVLGYFGSLQYYEGLEDLCSAVEILAAERPDLDVSCIILGDGPYASEVEARVKSSPALDRIQLKGRVPHEQLQGYFGDCAAMVYPRRAMPVSELISPLKPFEPMAYGVPVIGSDVAALREIVQDEVTGFTFEAGNPRKLAERIQYVLTTPEHVKEVIAQAKGYVRERSWVSTARPVAEMYQRLWETNSGK